MAIRPSDAYRLWGRAGGRCSICRVSLTHVAHEGLLCPNDHTRVDRDVDQWSCQRLKDTKASHESWVQEQIDQGRLQPIPERAETFRLSRLTYWGQQRSGQWLYAALTPLDVVDDVFDPLTSQVKEHVKSIQVPDAYAQSKSTPNPYHIESSASGLAGC